ncbi:hypothetical protein M427DRAFT_154113 [Gonapodya prolifera JEL478]|uniref:F-box domain-containing protein n=1 Tax=Gonapodya prolifera (strain JEL478) TaxID=1344416 RepID=A0A139AJM6_GONPJ|nr:hypothetical protein M427DRAFT_154113 [Gonapodya prolifera JEL478]|eukprot:KXS16987.1 hypothetical protein M427DRAFT_154113 [Gonapodya prolifera JEL478]
MSGTVNSNSGTPVPSSPATRCCSIPELLDRIVDFFAENNSRDAIADLSLVCKAWHQTIVSRLWHHIKIDRRNGFGPPIAISAFARFRPETRSLIQPVSITLGAFTTENIAELADFLSAVGPSVTQWVMKTNCARGFVRYLARFACFDIVRRLDITIRAVDDVEAMDILLRQCTMLEDLSITEGTDPTVHASLGSLCAPEQIQKFIFKTADPQKRVSRDVYKDISRMTNVEYLRIEEGYISNEKLSMLATLSRIRKLVLNTFNTCEDSFYMSEDVQNNRAPLQKLLETNGPHLETLDITNFPSDVTLITIHCQALEELILDCCNIDAPRMVTGLVMSLPHLKLLCIREIKPVPEGTDVEPELDYLAEILAEREPKLSLFLDWRSVGYALHGPEFLASPSLYDMDALSVGMVVRYFDWDHWELK